MLITTNVAAAIPMLAASPDGIEFVVGSEAATGPLNLLLDGRRVWSFHIEETGLRHDRGGLQYRFQPWPEVLVPYLRGRTDVALYRPGAAEPLAGVLAQFGDSAAPLRFEDDRGRALVVNKWMRLGRVIEDFDGDARTRLLDHADEVRTVLVEELGLDIYVTGGSLLGPVRDGKLMGNDDDIDLGYLSRYSHPTDVASENYQIGRVMCAAGFQTQRLSAGHLQVHFQHEGHDDHYIDVFTSWLLEDWWYQLFCVRARVGREDLLPIRGITVNGREEPSPQVPERMLEAIYGPGWKVPDPAFRFETPRATARRLFGWCGDLNMHREFWTSHYRSREPAAPLVPDGEPSDFARWVAQRATPKAAMVELGCGRGQDALWFAAHGHQVHAVDYVRQTVPAAQRVAEAADQPATFAVLNIYDLRNTVTFGASLAAHDEGYAVYAHGLLSALDDPGRANLLRLLSMLLRGGGRGYLDFHTPKDQAQPGPLDERTHRLISVEELTGELARVGIHVLDHTLLPTDGDADSSETARMVVAWSRRASKR
ncbi:MAG: class I SAM-dependent methyltransferase [Sciscionella sp.]